jgi:hypothetical protein
MRVLFDELECPLCKVQQNIVIFTSNPNALFADLIQKKDRMMWDGKCKGMLLFSLRLQPSHLLAYFEDMAYESDVRNLWELKCSVCSAAFPSMNQLSNHIKGAHNLQYWDVNLALSRYWFFFFFFPYSWLLTCSKICLENQKVFFCEKVLYNAEELRLHNKNGMENLIRLFSLLF